jgi:hypothetical protein
MTLVAPAYLDHHQYVKLLAWIIREGEERTFAALG